MIERKLIKEKINNYKIQQFLLEELTGKSYSHSIIKKTPLGEKILIYSSKPGLIVGRGGSNIKSIVKKLKKKFDMESPQVEVQEINEPNLDPSIVAERVSQMLLRMGTGRFKFIGHRVAEDVIKAGAIGVEIKMKGKVPSKRSKTWVFNEGYLPKCGEPAMEYVEKGYRIAELKPGIAGVTVKILPPDTVMPDDVKIMKKVEKEEEESEEEEVEEESKDGDEE